jgi:glutaminyl-tRNA synthetase
MGVLRPLRVVLENFPEGEDEWFDAPWFSDAPAREGRRVPLSRVIYVEREDFAEVPPKGWFRLSPGAEVRLRHACLVRCVGVVKDDAGEVTELRCTWDPDSRGGTAKDGRKVKGTLHWVSASRSVPAQARLYDRLFRSEHPGLRSPGTGADSPKGTTEADDFLKDLNPASCEVVTARLEPAMADAAPGDAVQLERVGYFCVDRDSRPGALVLNRTIGLKDSWARAQGR